MSEEKKNEQERTPEELKRHKELLKKKALEQSEVKEVLNVIQKYAKPTATIILLICTFFLINTAFKNKRLKAEEAADSALLKARVAADFQAIIDQHGKTPAAPVAMLGLARVNFNDGLVEVAESTYDAFLKKYGTHAMAEQAEFGLITCKEAQGHLEDAIRLYDEFKTKHPNSYLAVSALMQKAFCQKTAGKTAEAKQTYEDIIAFYPDTQWATLAASNLKSLR